MQPNLIFHFTSAIGSSIKPAMAALVAGAAGVTAFASPLAPADRAGFRAMPPAPQVRLAIAPVRAEMRPVTAVVARIPASEMLHEVSPAQREEQSDLAPTAELDDFAEVASFRLSPKALAPAPEAALMPGAELKAMMAQVAASRGQTEALAYASVEPVKPQPAITAAAPSADGIEFDVAALVNGKPAGRVPLRIVDGQTISVRLADVLAVLEPMMDGAAYSALSTSEAANEYVSFNTLRAQGVAVRFDSDDRLVLGSS